MDDPAPAEEECALSPPFNPLRSSVDWMRSTHTGEGQSSGLLIQMPVGSRDTFIDKPRNNILAATWASLSPIKSTHQMNHQNSHRNVTKDETSGRLRSKLRLV